MPFGNIETAISGVPVPQTTIGEVAKVKFTSLPAPVEPLPILPLIR